MLNVKFLCINHFNLNVPINGLNKKKLYTINYKKIIDKRNFNLNARFYINNYFSKNKKVTEK